ncbi:MAG: hypothetical protein ACLQDQ_05455 [Myxococcaceae bacterium]
MKALALAVFSFDCSKPPDHIKMCVKTSRASCVPVVKDPEGFLKWEHAHGQDLNHDKPSATAMNFAKNALAALDADDPAARDSLIEGCGKNMTFPDNELGWALLSCVDKNTTFQDMVECSERYKRELAK